MADIASTYPVTKDALQKEPNPDITGTSGNVLGPIIMNFLNNVVSAIEGFVGLQDDGVGPSIASGWISESTTGITQGSSSTFVIPGVDRTKIYTAGRKVRFNIGGTPVYAAVLSSSFSTNTTVTIVGTTVPATITTLEYGLMLSGYAAGLKSAVVATASSGAATANGYVVDVTSESLTTGAGSNYTLTLTNSLVTSASEFMITLIQGGTNTRGPLSLVSVTPSTGSVAIVVQNNNASALNGTIRLIIEIIS